MGQTEANAGLSRGPQWTEVETDTLIRVFISRSLFTEQFQCHSKGKRCQKLGFYISGGDTDANLSKKGFLGHFP